jgi:hypothetical protein
MVYLALPFFRGKKGSSGLLENRLKRGLRGNL